MNMLNGINAMKKSIEFAKPKPKKLTNKWDPSKKVIEKILECLSLDVEKSLSCLVCATGYSIVTVRKAVDLLVKCGDVISSKVGYLHEPKLKLSGKGAL